MCGTGVMLLLTALMVYYMKVQSDSFRDQTELLRKQASTPQQIQQPVSVTISEELHKVFAAKEAFENHVAENKDDHDKLFSKIGGVERGGRDEVERKITLLSTQLNSTNATMHETKGEMKQLTSQLVLIQQELARR